MGNLPGRHHKHGHKQAAADKPPAAPKHVQSPRSCEWIPIPKDCISSERCTTIEIHPRRLCPLPATIRNRKTVTGFSGVVTEKYKVDKKVLGEGHYGTVRKSERPPSQNIL